MSKENKLKVNMGLKSCDKCEYYLRCEECVGSHYREEMPKLNQRITDLEEQLKEKDLAIDKFLKIDIWLTRKYGKKLYKDFNITNDDTDIKNFIKISQVFDNIYEEMNKEMPLMWFNYGFFGLPKLDKGE